MRFLEELENAILDENFYKTNEVIEKIRENENAFEYLSYISEFCKKDSKNINHRWIANEIKNQFNNLVEQKEINSLEDVIKWRSTTKSLVH